eukprot:CAMPEP_0206248572 /NCGR_PEP_ID=MMETSP0047_2-20121206/20442_1 /ASSEMBLY_ACC=CAM_ASM_000192 /TAXON_ID=195065 /ORGANISM="Chroomonas mesostigmatica_cf, Strain CCMP1168" /LENGTH=423 /DNA_ID=CAMNT_0053674227 /DNA_START=28 /DNA_END=1300 /DNA_ORIENTATION=-
MGDSDDERDSKNFKAVPIDQKLKIYYSNLFPYAQMYRWLSYSGNAEPAKGDAFSRREFSFTLKDDIYIRYLSYDDAEQWRADMIKKLPHKMDLGAIYRAQPKQKNMLSKEAFKEVEREFIIDIDLTDYESENIISTNCVNPGDDSFKYSFKFMVVAVKVLDLALREDFGFETCAGCSLGGVVSIAGSPTSALREMNNQVRSMVAEYLNVFKGGEKEKSKLSAMSGNLHPALRRASREIEPYFEEMIEEQNWFAADRCDIVLALIPDESIRDTLSERWRGPKKNKPGLEKWEELKKEIGKKGTIKNGAEIINSIMFFMCYPRLDINVSKAMNHLLKAPFVVHPKTERICVPLDPRTIQDFDPATVPTINEILSQLDSNTDKSVKDSEKTDLAHHLKTFERTFLKPLERKVAQEKLRANQEIAAF